MIDRLGLESPVVGEIGRELVIQKLDAYPLNRRQSFRRICVEEALHFLI